LNADTTIENYPFFPLDTVLFPGGILPLQIFEQRYLDLVKSCMKNEHGFIVVLINSGKEVDDTPEIYSIGTYANIIDWESLDSGLLGITVQGSRRVQLHSATAKDNGLLVGQTIDIDNHDDGSATLDEEHSELVKTLKELSKHPFVAQRYPDIDYSSASTVCNRLSELLPIPNIVKQELLETTSLSLHIEKLQNIIGELAN
jgi:Lon protease-like protein